MEAQARLPAKNIVPRTPKGKHGAAHPLEEPRFLSRRTGPAPLPGGPNSTGNQEAALFLDEARSAIPLPKGPKEDGKRREKLSILDRAIENPMRTDDKAWELVEDNWQKLVPQIINKYGLMAIVRRHFGKNGFWKEPLRDFRKGIPRGEPILEEVCSIVIGSLFNSARAWDEGRVAKFSTYAIGCGIECISWVCQLIDPSIPRRTYEELGAYFKMKRENPQYKLEDYIKYKGYSPRRASGLRKALRAVSRMKWDRVGADAVFNGALENPNVGDAFTAVAQLELLRMDQLRTDAREALPGSGREETDVMKFMGEALKSREYSIVCMHFGIGAGNICAAGEDGGANSEPMTLEAIGDVYSISRQRVKQILDRALAKLLGSGYADELRGHLETLSAERQYRGTCALGND